MTLKGGVEYTPAVRKALIDAVRAAIGPIATPDVIHVTAELPKTRSGKIMRRMCVVCVGGARYLTSWLQKPSLLFHPTPAPPFTPHLARRRLRKISTGETDTEQMGDVSTLADAGVLQRLIDSKPKA